MDIMNDMFSREKKAEISAMQRLASPSDKKNILILKLD